MTTRIYWTLAGYFDVELAEGQSPEDVVNDMTNEQILAETIDVPTLETDWDDPS
jgi:hypothetical protein